MDFLLTGIRDNAAGFFAPVIIYAGILALHLLLPARRVTGYVVNETNGKQFGYRINGFIVMLVTVLVWAALGATDIVPFEWLYHQRWASFAGACTLGLIASFAIVYKKPPVHKHFLADFFLGRLKNVQFFGGRADAKMVLYLLGATLLALNILSAAAYHVHIFQPVHSPGILVYTVLFFWFLFDYMTFEEVHLYTYDLFAERVGFKLVWGCLTFYPFFYSIGILAVAHRPDPGITTPQLLVACVVFFSGWIFARGANMQKFFFKTRPDQAFLGIWKPEVLSNGNSALLCNGFWGISRHVNYLGEVLMATGITLALGYPEIVWAWFYPLYYVLLLSTRERDDDKRCKDKYGDLWDQYCERVPSRIIPRIY